MKPHRVPAQMGVFYHLLFRRRLQGDYTITTTYEAAEVQTWLAEAKEFIGAIARLLQAQE